MFRVYFLVVKRRLTFNPWIVERRRPTSILGPALRTTSSSLHRQNGGTSAKGVVLVSVADGRRGYATKVF